MRTEIPEAVNAYQLAKHLHLDKAPSLVIGTGSKQQIGITRLTSQNGIPEQTASIPREKAFVVSVHLTPACDQGCEIWVDDQYSRITSWPAGGVGIYDLETNPRWRNPGPFDWVHYNLDYAQILAIFDVEPAGPTSSFLLVGVLIRV